MIRSVHVLIRGRVQGVGFRWYTLRQAEALGVSGWVRNLPAGEVEAFAQGAEADVDALLAALRVGPSYAAVTQVVVSEVPPSSVSGFRVR